MNPTPTPSTSTGALDVALSNYWLAISLLVAAIVVIILALTFAWLYHRRALETLEQLASTSGAGSVGVESQDAVTSRDLTSRVIVGSLDGQKGVGLMYVITGWQEGDTVEWIVPDADIEIVDERTMIAKFKKDGTFTVKATVTDDKGSPIKVDAVTVTIAPAAAAAPALVIPFVVRNWGRLVIVLFGVGVISALMATKILDAAAGVGILGTLLGAGAASAATGGSEATTAKPAPSDGDQNTPAG